jgi:Type II secretion system (T2SS), protein F
MVTQTPIGATCLAMVLVAVAILVVPDRTRLPNPIRSADLVVTPSTSAANRGRRAIVAAVALTAACIALVPGLWWAYLPVAVAVGAALARAPTRLSPTQRAADRRLVAVYAGLLASCLDAGMAVGAALRAVTEVLTDRDAGASSVGQTGAVDRKGLAELDRGRPLAVLDQVAAMLSLGADSETAWRIVDLGETLAPLAAAARRSAAGGGALADAAREVAEQLRQETAAESVRAAGRAGVLMTAPLGLCFLPAFLCLGLAPVVVGLLGQLEIF